MDPTINIFVVRPDLVARARCHRINFGLHQTPRGRCGLPSSSSTTDRRVGGARSRAALTRPVCAAILLHGLLEVTRQSEASITSGRSSSFTVDLNSDYTFTE